MTNTNNADLAALAQIASVAVEAAYKAVLAVNTAIDNDGHKLAAEVYRDREFQTLRVDLCYDLSAVLRTRHHLDDVVRDLQLLDGEQSYADYIKAEVAR